MSKNLDFRRWYIGGHPITFVRPKIRIERDTLVLAVQECLDNDEEPNKTNVHKAIRVRAHDRGQDGIDFWSDDQDGGDEAEAIARTLYPEAFQ
jgi:hypothetical protein